MCHENIGGVIVCVGAPCKAKRSAQCMKAMLEKGSAYYWRRLHIPIGSMRLLVKPLPFQLVEPPPRRAFKFPPNSIIVCSVTLVWSFDVAGRAGIVEVNTKTQSNKL